MRWLTGLVAYLKLNVDYIRYFYKASIKTQAELPIGRLCWCPATRLAIRFLACNARNANKWM